MNDLNNSKGLTDLEAIIQDLITELENYAKRTDANLFYIDKRNALIQKLIDVYNSIDMLNLYDIWLNIEAKIKEIENKDKEISGHTIYLQMSPTGNNNSIITFNPFKL
ncbi:MAG: hypothetical protein V4608_12540 [Bacteroidota bacterium]